MTLEVMSYTLVTLLLILEVMSPKGGVITSTKYKSATIPQLIPAVLEVMSFIYT